MKNPKKIFLLDDDELIVSMLSRSLKKEGYKVIARTDADRAIDRIKACDPDIVLLDITLRTCSGLDILQDLIDQQITTQVVMLTADDTAETAVKAMKMGAADYITKPFNTDELKIVLRNIIEKERLQHEVDFLRKAYSELVEKDFIGQTDAVKKLMEDVAKMAAARVSNVLITGESGAGKELLARQLHRSMYEKGTSGRAPFVTVNCAAMPESLLESELFGYQKGSFTDAKSDKKGLFELAEGGSILLDEIGEMKPDLQSKLLRVLEDRTVRRIGGKGEVAIDATIIATTNKNLSEAVKKGEFRKDLFFRLSTFYLHIIPLRERKEDIPLLARHFLSHFAARYNNKTVKRFSDETEQLLMTAGWPGNVRELKNMIERIVVLENVEEIGPQHIPHWITGDTMSDNTLAGNGFRLPESGIDLEILEKNLIRQALEKAQYNKALAAKLLNISYDSLRYQVKKFGLEDG